MGKRNTVVTKPTVATEPSEAHFDESEPSDPMQFEQASLGREMAALGRVSVPTVLNPEAIGNPNLTPIVQLPPDMAQALVDSGQCARVSTPKPAATRPRRVSAEATKAETRLINLERATQASIAACTAGWAAKRQALIASLPHDVQGMLLAGGVITDDDLEGIRPL